MRRLLMVVLAAAVPTAAYAGPYLEYPAPEPYPFQRSALTPRIVAIQPYDHAFRVRVYTTPPTQPYYNVPPYAVITPY